MKKRFSAILIMIPLLLLCAETAWCKNVQKAKEGAYYLSPAVGGYYFNSPRGLEDQTYYGLKFGYDFPGHGVIDSLGVEGLVTKSQARGDSGAEDASVYQFRLDTIHPLLVKKKFVPFLALGAGWVTVDGEPLADDGIVFAVGFGAKYSLTNYLLLRADFRDMVWFEPDQDNYIESSIGLTYIFGQKRIKKPPPPPDSDRDGVADSQDRCPDTPRGLQVDKRGCPTDKTDSDGDKVYDYRDECKDTPSGTDVDEVGCPRDSDGDKIPDFRDRCPGTPAGIETDDSGCVKLSESTISPGRLVSTVAADADSVVLPGSSQGREPVIEGLAPLEEVPVEDDVADARVQQFVDVRGVVPVTSAMPEARLTGVALSDQAAVDSDGAVGEQQMAAVVLPEEYGHGRVSPVSEGVAGKQRTVITGAVELPAVLERSAHADAVSSKSASTATEVRDAEDKSFVPIVELPAEADVVGPPVEEASPTLVPVPRAPAATVAARVEAAVSISDTEPSEARHMPTGIVFDQRPWVAPQSSGPSNEGVLRGSTGGETSTVLARSTEGPSVAESLPYQLDEAPVEHSVVDSIREEKTIESPAVLPVPSAPAVVGSQTVTVASTVPDVDTYPEGRLFVTFESGSASADFGARSEMAEADTTGPHPGKAKILEPAASDEHLKESERRPPGPGRSGNVVIEDRTAVAGTPSIIRVGFGFNRATVQEDFAVELKKIAKVLKEFRMQLIIVEGHTDSRGSHAYNDRLSERRAASVKSYLVEMGVAPTRITTVGYGERRPIADNATEEGRRQNRRAMIIYLPGNS